MWRRKDVSLILWTHVVHSVRLDLPFFPLCAIVSQLHHNSPKKLLGYLYSGMQLVSFLFYVRKLNVMSNRWQKIKKCAPLPFFSSTKPQIPLIIQMPTVWPLTVNKPSTIWHTNISFVRKCTHICQCLTLWSCTWMLEDYMQCLKSIITHLLSSHNLQLPEVQKRKWVTLTPAGPGQSGYFCQANVTRF